MCTASFKFGLPPLPIRAPDPACLLTKGVLYTAASLPAALSWRSAIPARRAGLTEPKGHNMPFYETVLIARSDITQQQVEAVADTIATNLGAEGGLVKKREYWGLRSLAYRIKKNRKAHYMLLGLDAQPPSIKEMERQLGLDENILRFMTLRVEEIEEAPSAILLRKSDDRERSFRGPKPAGRFDSGRKRGYDEREEFRARSGGDDAPRHESADME